MMTAYSNEMLAVNHSQVLSSTTYALVEFIHHFLQDSSGDRPVLMWRVDKYTNMALVTTKCVQFY